MLLRWWELLFVGALFSLAALFFVSGQLLAGVVLVSVAVFATASRAEVLEKNVAGHYAHVRGNLALGRAIALFVIYVAVCVLFFVMRIRHWTRDAQGRVAFYASAALAFYLLRDVWRYGREAEDWLTGSEAEVRVARELDPLRERGWLVVHDVKREGRGNLDHFVSGATGAYAIETKSGRYRAADRGQTVSNAIWAKTKFGQRWVTAVLCVGKEPPSAPYSVRHGDAVVWIMGFDQVQQWLVTPK